MIDTSVCGTVGIVILVIALAMYILISRRSGQRQTPINLKLPVVLIAWAALSVATCTFLGYIAYSAGPSPVEAQLHPERAAAASSYIVGWIIVVGLIYGVVGLGLIHWLKSRSKEQSPPSTEDVPQHRPTGDQVSPTDQD